MSNEACLQLAPPSFTHTKVDEGTYLATSLPMYLKMGPKKYIAALLFFSIQPIKHYDIVDFAIKPFKEINYLQIKP
jgi:hypothetical protein